MAIRKFDKVANMPTAYCHSNLDKLVRITRVSGDFDWTAWTTIVFTCPDLTISKSLAGGEITVVDADSIDVQLLDADFVDVSLSDPYVYQIVVGDGANTYNAGEGQLIVVREVA